MQKILAKKPMHTKVLYRQDNLGLFIYIYYMLYFSADKTLLLYSVLSLSQPDLLRIFFFVIRKNFLL